VIGQEELPLRGALAAAHSRLFDAACQSRAPARPSDYRTDDSAEGDYDRASRSRDEAVQQAKNGSAARVQIETCVVPGRGGRPATQERYPFAALLPVTVDERGDLSGPCFFIPNEDNPARRIAAARKRHKGKVFITRLTKGGRMVWREK
jgi:hypothetical protein